MKTKMRRAVGTSSDEEEKQEGLPDRDLADVVARQREELLAQVRPEASNRTSGGSRVDHHGRKVGHR